MLLSRATALKSKPESSYQSFDQLDGRHPWMEVVKDGFVPYRVRELQKGNVTYFNFALAKEMGLISTEHPNHMTKELESKCIETFSIQIINEYDQENNVQFDPKTIKPNAYMASRYLQLQHSNKQGKTSGDGRGIWNGVVQHRGKIWDVSSRGTGVTRLAPGAVEANKPLKTGGEEYGYGCGKAEIDELYGAAILAEIMHLQGVPTERVLCIIDIGKGFGIGVRAAPNLIRPAHIFIYLKQNRRKDLKAALDYFIHRQEKNGKIKLNSIGSKKYDELIEILSLKFAQFAALLDVEYIFAWLDWDGDNVLADAGIIDYGSIRQFGLRHDHYRYDDVERFSTNLNEQRAKARLIVQVFAQITDYIRTGTKKPLKVFSGHPAVQRFNEHFSQHRAERLLYKMGFSETQRKNILQDKTTFLKFDREYTYFERAKVSGSIQKVADGVNHPALFNMRRVLRELPKHLLSNKCTPMAPNDFFKLMLSSFAKQKDARMRPKHKKHIESFQLLYIELLSQATGKTKIEKVLPAIIQRSDFLNRDDRMTGNALIQIVEEIIESKKRGLEPQQIQKLIDQLVVSNLGCPEVDTGKYYEQKPRLTSRGTLFSKIVNLIKDYNEDI